MFVSRELIQVDSWWLWCAWWPSLVWLAHVPAKPKCSRQHMTTLCTRCATSECEKCILSKSAYNAWNRTVIRKHTSAIDPPTSSWEVAPCKPPRGLVLLCCVPGELDRFVTEGWWAHFWPWKVLCLSFLPSWNVVDLGKTSLKKVFSKNPGLI